VFSSVGFGDITAKTQLARLVAIGQTIADLVILGVAIKVVLGAFRRRRQGEPGQHSGTTAAPGKDGSST
jgi:voltage-gated potassium channel